MSNLRVYLSHTFLDSQKVFFNLKEALSNRGYEVWHDSLIPPGFDISSEKENAIKKSDVFIILLNETDLSNELTREEYGMILGHVAHSNKLLLPLVLDDFDHRYLPDSLNRFGILYAKNLRIEELVNKISNSINYYLGKRGAEEIKNEKLKEQIESSFADYVNPILEDLNKREKYFNSKAMLWNFLGYFSLILGLVVSIVIIVVDFNRNTAVDWSKVLYTAIKGAIILTLLIASSKYSFTLAKSFMSESLKNADRIHAISFGRFYLQVFDKNITANDFKDIFSNWNTSKESAFNNLSSDGFDPKLSESFNKVVDTFKELTLKQMK